MPLTLLLHGRHEGAAVYYEPFGPWLVPWHYTSFEAEYQALRQATGLSDLSCYAVVEVQGRDRAGFLHSLLSAPIKRLQPGQGARAALLDPTAYLLADVLVLALPEAHWLLCPLEQSAGLAAALERYIFTEDVRILNRERPYAVLGLHGPQLSAWCRNVLESDIPAATYAHREGTVDGRAVRWVRFSPFGIDGVLCLVEHAQSVPLWETLRARKILPVGWQALNTARLEQGMPWYGLDADATNLLPETGLEAIAASDDKGCYIGQEIVARMQTYGSANKKLMGLIVEGEGALTAGAELLHGSDVVGRVTSAAYSPTLQRWIGLGYLKRGAYEAGLPMQLPDGQTVIVADRPLIGLPSKP